MALASFPVTLSCSHSVRDWGDRRRDLAVVNLIREAAVADQEGDAGQVLEDLSSNYERHYSTRNASSGEIKLARSAGINDATNADSPSVTTAASVTAGLYGFMP